MAKMPAVASGKEVTEGTPRESRDRGSDSSLVQRFDPGAQKEPQKGEGYISTN